MTPTTAALLVSYDMFHYPISVIYEGIQTKYPVLLQSEAT